MPNKIYIVSIYDELTGDTESYYFKNYQKSIDFRKKFDKNFDDENVTSSQSSDKDFIKTFSDYDFYDDEI